MKTKTAVIWPVITYYEPPSVPFTYFPHLKQEVNMYQHTWARWFFTHLSQPHHCNVCSDSTLSLFTPTAQPFHFEKKHRTHLSRHAFKLVPIYRCLYMKNFINHVVHVAKHLLLMWSKARDRFVLGSGDVRSTVYV